MFPNAKAGYNILKTLGIWGHTLILVEWTYPNSCRGCYHRKRRAAALADALIKVDPNRSKE